MLDVLLAIKQSGASTSPDRAIDAGLHRLVLEHGLDHQLAWREVAEIEGRRA